MLDPQDRRLLLEALRPPQGCRFDRAIGTTYSLDLVSLLMAPLAFTRFEVASTDTSLQVDPLAWLESLRRHADRIGIYCQAGQIAVPPIDNRLYGYLEQAVVEVSAPSPHGVFHPKVWAIRFTHDDGSIRYRLLCMSRNMTFDRSWDTMLVLDGSLTDREQPRSVPLGEFFAALPGRARASIAETVRDHTDVIQQEIRSVSFELPAGFTDLAFRPIGLGGADRWPFPVNHDRVLIISPFVTAPTLRELTKSTTRSVLVGRQDELDRLSLGEGWFEKVFTLSQGVDPEEIDADTAVSATEDADVVAIAPASSDGLTGLHAKLYLFEQGNEARLFTGSANATTAAFDANVEFLVELVADKRTHGIDAMLRAAQGETRLIDLLQAYEPPTVPTEAPAEQILDDLLSAARHTIGSAPFAADVSPIGDAYQLCVTLSSDHVLEIDADIVATCRPVTLSDASASPLPRATGERVCFAPVSFDALTSFIAVELGIERDGVRRSTCFSMNLPVTGMPADRAQRLLRAMLVDRERFLRFLLLLLMDDDAMFSPQTTPSVGTAAFWGTGNGATGLLESLVQAFDRHLEKLDQIERLVTDLCATEDGRRVLPEGFMEIWEPVWEARQASMVQEVPT